MSKKNKKVKGKTLDLTDFMNEGNTPIQKGYALVQSDSDLGPIFLPTGPVSSRNVDETKVPKEPPYVAFLGNLPFEIVEEEVATFFNELKLTSVRLARDSSERFRGFGYAEFEDRNSLIEALRLDGGSLRGRVMRISLPNENEGDSRSGFGRDRGMRGERPIERDLPSDWRAASREEQASRGFDSYNRSDRSDRSDRYGSREGGGGFGDRDRERDRGANDSRDWRNESRGFSRYEPPRDTMESSGPAERPKLKIAPRTKPVEPIKVEEEADDKKVEKEKIEKPKAADIFGAAKPVDTTAKLQEIEKRLDARQKEDLEKSRIDKGDAQQKASSKETSPRHQGSEEDTKKWRDEIRDDRKEKDRKQRSERRAPAQVVEESSFNPTSKNKYAGLEDSENPDECETEDGIQAEN